MSGVVAHRVRRSYEQIYDQLRAAMLSGAVSNGERLPSESQLAANFGVSRSTVREALRLLLAEGLIRTVPGSGGGSFVVLPTVDHISDFLRRNLELLSLKDDVTLAEFLEARELIEVFVVRNAAIRRTEADIAALRSTLLPADTPVSPEARYLENRRFHEILIDACGNTLLQIASAPVFSVLHTHLMRSTLTSEFPRAVCRDHAEILAAIEARDPGRAGALMSAHLEGLGEIYREIWFNG
jgi:DNA-binding FadR family transcriptional regulator